MKLKESVDITIVAETDRVPIEALQRLRDERAAADLASEHIKNGTRYRRSGEETKGLSTPNKEKILRKELRKVS